METFHAASEIVEVKEKETDGMDDKAADSHMPNSGNDYCLMDDIDRLFESIDIKNSARSLTLSRNNGKQPIRVSSAKAAGIGIAEPVSLKQALRGLCISQASEMAAMKRLSKPPTSARVSEAGTIKRLYTSVVVEAHGARSQQNGGKGSHVEISLAPEISTSAEKMVENMQMPQADVLRSSIAQSNLLTDAALATGSSFRLASRNQVIPFHAEADNKKLLLEVNTRASSISHSSEEVLDTGKAACKSNEVSVSSLGIEKVPKEKLNSSSSFSTCSRLDTTTSSGNCFMKPIFKHKNFFKKKVKQPSTLISSSPCNNGAYNDLDPCTSDEISESNIRVIYHKKDRAENPSPSSSSSNGTEIDSRTLCKDSSKLSFGLNCGKRTRILTTKTDETSKSKEKGEFSQSSKSSIGDYSSNTSVSDESNLSGSCRNDHRPHMSKDLRWEAVRLVQQEHGSLNLRQFKLLRRLGCGDIGTVYLADLMGTNCLFAIKVMDNEFLANQKKMFRAQTEKAILQMLDHPFLPTLYAHFVTDRLSCLVMEYCRGGDLHVLRQRQPGRSFPEQAARFYVAEVLLALEYLHMLGVVYRDLKPENILVREDGHIMLIDFDLSLRCTVNPMLLKSSSHTVESKKKNLNPCAEASCIHPFCLQPNWQVPCFTPIVISSGAKSRKLKSDHSAQENALPQVVVEPTDARSNSFVGTHEYLAPEIVKSESHGSAVDWWTFGIFLFELLYGKTPFKGSGDEDTLNNIVSKSLKFPDAPMVSFHARDLIRGLLVKDPENRLGSVKGAAEIKQHPFFAGLNWALIRCAVPPELPKSFDFGCKASTMSLKEDPANDLGNTEDISVFELF